MSKIKTLIIGASTNPTRYAYIATQRLDQSGHEVVLLGNKSGSVIGQNIATTLPVLTDIHTITLYVNPAIQKKYYYDYILQTQPKRLIFNPGTENQELRQLASKKGIDVWEACTLVLLSTNQY